MCNESCILFVARSLDAQAVQGRTVLELGAKGFGARPLLKSWQPAEYVGVDLTPGPGVDLVCSAEDLTSVFSADHFDVVLSTEMLEHVRDWKKVLAAIKAVCRPGGIVVLTTRSLGYPFHAAPHDYWRFEVSDMRRIFSDFERVAVESDRQEPGVFVSATKPLTDFVPVDLSEFDLYSMVENRRIRTIPPGPVSSLRSMRLIWEGRLRQTVRAVTETLRGRPPGLRFQVEVGKE